MDVKVNSILIRSERENRGWTQEHLATVTGLSLRTIHRIEKTGSASLESVTALASVLAVDIATLRARQPVPSRQWAIHISLDLPLRLALAAVSGVLCALHFRRSYYTGWGTPDFGFEWLDFGMAGTLFGLAVLCPWLRPGRGLVLRALALIAASSLSYFCAFMALSSEAWFSTAPVLTSYLLASIVGLTLVLVAAKILIPLRVTAAYWFPGLMASLVGGAAIYTVMEFDFGDSPLGISVGFCVWQMMACVAIYRGHNSQGTEGGILAAFMRTRGRFSIVPGWMKTGLSTAA